MEKESIFYDKNSSESISILVELCMRNDILYPLMDEKLTQAKKGIKNEGIKGSQALARLITELIDCRNGKINWALDVAMEVEPTSDLVNAIQQILSTHVTKIGEQGHFMSEVFGSGKIGWTDSTYQLIISAAKKFLQKVSNETSNVKMNQLLPLFTVKMEIPDIPSAHLIEIYDAFYFNSGSVVFKASFNWEGKKIQGLFALNKNGLKTVIAEDDKIPTQSTKNLFNNLKIKFISPTDNLRDYYYFNGSDLLYLNIKVKTGIASRYSIIYSWDGESLKKVLSKGDKIQIDQQLYTIFSARLSDIGQEGIGFIHYVTSGPDKTAGVALHINNTIKHLYRNNDILTGHKQFQIKLQKFLSGDENLFKESAIRFGGLGDFALINSNQIFDDALIMRIAYPKEPLKEGIFNLHEKVIERIIEIDDDCPINPERSKVCDIDSVFAITRERMLISIRCGVKSLWQSDIGEVSKGYILLYDKGKFIPLMSYDINNFLGITNVITNPDDESCILFSILIQNINGGELKTQILLRNEGKIKDLTHDVLLGRIQKMQVIKYPHKGVLIEYKKLINVKDIGLAIENVPSFCFLYFDQLDKGLEPAPEIVISPDESFTLNEVLVWKNKNEAIVIKKEGLFLLNETDENKI